MASNLLNYVLGKEHHMFRKEVTEKWADEYQTLGLSAKQRMSDRFERLIKLEVPHILPDEKIVFMRTVKNIPDIFTANEWEKINTKHYIHELGYMSNVSPNYEETLEIGLLEKRKTADKNGKRCIDNIIDLANRYKIEAEKQGRNDVAEVLSQVPCFGARNFREALQFFRILHYALWLEGNYHNTIGRFDQYMYQYYKKDIDSGALTKEEAQELLEDFFISFNIDSDLYVGVQQGDNGQSMVLGGCDENGIEIFNELSELCLIVSKNMKLIDPKINLRVNKNTPTHIFELGSELTKAGLGFPQYSNDDVVIQGLTNLGYDHKDACNYVVAACWEFIIPKCGGDVNNIGALSFPKVVDTVLHKSLVKAASFEELMIEVESEIKVVCDQITGNINDLWFVPSPFLSLLMDDIKYNNFGIHGTGVATAADSLAAIKKYVYDEKIVTPMELIEAVDSNFEEQGKLLSLLRNEAPKMGVSSDESADNISIEILDYFANSLEGKKNCRGGIYRAGTGSAMYYLWHADEIGASPDGRKKGEPFGANFSPSHIAKVDGPISVITSFTKQNFDRVINGGPLTMEFHSSIFANEDSIKKMAMFVKTYIKMGGHQLQLNAFNPEVLRDAQKHPEKYQNLVVRIWGWSAYFVELDKEYQEHVLARNEYIL